MRFETERLILRELTTNDLESLFEILSDVESMKYYPRPYTKEEVVQWIQRNIDRYRDYGFGLWAIELKENHMFIGECGITMQNINGHMVPEIGYHIHKNHTRKGYASEAAQYCREYAFDTLGFDKIYSYMKYSNVASARVAQKVGMKFEYEYEDPKNRITKVYSMTKGEYLSSGGKHDVFSANNISSFSLPISDK